MSRFGKVWKLLSEIYEIMSKSIILKLNLFLIAILCLSNVSFSQTSADLAEEYNVYNDLLDEMFIGEFTEQLVVERFTEPNNLYIDYPKSHRKLVSRFNDTAKDFFEKNIKSFELENKFNVKVKINLLYGEERKKLFDELNANYFEWDKVFAKTYSKSGNQILTLSRVGFNNKKTKALVNLGYQCGWTCGEGNYILLFKKNEKWKIKKKSMTWIS